MTKEEIKKGIDEMEVYATVTAIEKDLDMPFSTLQKALTGTRSLPQKWHKPLRKYFLSKRDKEMIEPIQEVIVQNLTTQSKGKTKDLNEKKVSNYPINAKGGGKKESDYLASRRKMKS
jgi:hypothetical protein